MARMTIELSQFKSAGVYTVEIDQSERVTVTTQTLRLVPGFATRGVYNSPVFIRSTTDRFKFYGTDSKLERKGSFFQRSIDTCLQTSPVFALNLIKVNESPAVNLDKVGFVALSVDSNNSTQQDVSTNDLFVNFFKRDRFWTPSSDYLQGVVNNSLGISEANKYSAPFLSIANTSTRNISFIVRKAGNVSGYTTTAMNWYGSQDAIPYKWIRP